MSISSRSKKNCKPRKDCIGDYQLLWRNKKKSDVTIHFSSRSSEWKHQKLPSQRWISFKSCIKWLLNIDNKRLSHSYDDIAIRFTLNQTCNLEESECCVQSVTSQKSTVFCETNTYESLFFLCLVITRFIVFKF